MKRREFLSWGTGGVAAAWSTVAIGLGALLRYLSPDVYYEPPQVFKVGNPADFPFGSPTFLPDEKIFVFRDKEKGFAVANAVCTHLGCTVQHYNSDGRFHCPCHGSVFGPDGEVLGGPAPKPLEWLEITLARDGQLQVDKSKPVQAAYRLIVKA